MLNIPKTFCPAKWDEIYINLSADYVYSCCKSIPIKITKKEDIIHALDQQKNNLLNGIQDESCEYCWKIENEGHRSLRNTYLENFDATTLDLYKNNQNKYKAIEINLGNECNFQCVYCNPKFSSQWESDVKNKPYKTYSDRFFYSLNEKNTNVISDSIDWLTEYKSIEHLEIIGGEPLLNKNFFKILNCIECKQIGFTTNLSCKTFTPIDNIFSLSKKYEKIIFGISIDSTGKNAEFSRYGMDFDLMLKNIEYVITNSTPQVEIRFCTLMTSITIRDFDNIYKLIEKFYNYKPKNVKWHISYCNSPLIFTMNTLPDNYKFQILESISKISNKEYIYGLDMLASIISTSKFNKTLYGQMKYFLEEFSSRKNIAIPVILD